MIRKHSLRKDFSKEGIVTKWEKILLINVTRIMTFSFQDENEIR